MICKPLAAIRFHLLAVVFMFTIVSAASARSPGFEVNIDKPERMVVPGGFTTFEIVVRNMSASELRIVTERTVNDLPDTSWHGSVCSEFNCYTEDVSLLPAESVAPGDSTFFKMHVTAGSDIDDTAKIVLRFYEEGSLEGIEQSFTIITVKPKPTIFAVNALQKEIETEAGSEAEFSIGLFNYLSVPLDMSVRRVENNFPNGSWQSRLCVPDSCLPYVSVETPTVTIEPGKAVYVRLRVLAGLGGEGKVTLRFDAGEVADPAYEQFTVSAIPLGVGEESREAAVAGAWPNPASSVVTIVLPEWVHRGDALQMELYDARGGRVADLTEMMSAALRRGDREVLVPAHGLIPGAYCYSITNEEHSRSGVFIVRP